MPMRFSSSSLLTLALLSPLCPAVEATAPDTHQELARAVLEFLSQTEICLNSCRSQESVQAALPRLRELAQEAEQLATRQKALPEPTVQDYMAAQSLVGDFYTLWSAIQKHLERLEKDRLLTPELRDILRIAPPDIAEKNAGE